MCVSVCRCRTQSHGQELWFHFVAAQVVSAEIGRGELGEGGRCHFQLLLLPLFFSSFSLLRYLKAQWHFNCLWLHKAQRRLRVFVSLFGRAVTCSRNLWLRLVAWVTGAAFPVYCWCCCCRLRRPLAAPKGGSNRVCFVLSALWLKFNFIHTAHMYACVCDCVCVCSCGDWQIAVGGMGGGVMWRSEEGEVSHYCSHFSWFHSVTASLFLFLSTPLPTLSALTHLFLSLSLSLSLLVLVSFVLFCSVFLFYSARRALSCHNYHRSALLQLLRIVFILDSLQQQQQQQQKRQQQHLQQQQQRQVCRLNMQTYFIWSIYLFCCSLFSQYFNKY